MRTRNRIAVVLAVIAVALAIIDGAAHAATSAPMAAPQPSSTPTPAPNVIMSFGQRFDPAIGMPTGPRVPWSQTWDESNSLVDCNVSECGGIVVRSVNGVRKAFLSLTEGEQVMYVDYEYQSNNHHHFGSDVWDGHGLRLKRYSSLFQPHELFKLNWIGVSVYNPNYPEPSWATDPSCGNVSCGKGGAA